jgi:hypothetical protein
MAYSTWGSDFVELVNSYHEAKAALETNNRDWAIRKLNDLKDEFALCEADPNHGKEATSYKNEIIELLSA